MQRVRSVHVLDELAARRTECTLALPARVERAPERVRAAIGLLQPQPGREGLLDLLVGIEVHVWHWEVGEELSQ
jgi:hypothetical protein